MKLRRKTKPTNLSIFKEFYFRFEKYTWVSICFWLQYICWSLFKIISKCIEFDRMLCPGREFSFNIAPQIPLLYVIRLPNAGDAFLIGLKYLQDF